jgi:hypothetical protein
MRRREAVRLFKEISNVIIDVSINSISLTPINPFKKDFELRISMALDDKSFKNVESIVKKHGMKLKEDNGFLLIYEAKPIEILA